MDQMPARWKVQRLSVGQDAHPVVVVDDFLPDPMAMRKFALDAPFGERDAAFPGAFAQTPVPTDVMSNALAHISPWPMATLLCRRVAFGRYIDDRTNLKLRVPHTDDLAAVAIVYLNPKTNGGTAFYRHRITDLEYMPSEVTGKMKTVMDGLGLTHRHELTLHLQGKMMLDELYPLLAGSTDDSGPAPEDQWEMIDRVPMRFNRLVMYDPRMFHNVYFDDCEGSPFGASPENARTILRASFSSR